MLAIVLSKAAFLKLGAIDPFQCSHKEIQEEMEGEGQQRLYIHTYTHAYIYIIFPPSLLLTPPPAKLAIVCASTWDTSGHIRKMAWCYILSKNWFLTVVFPSPLAESCSVSVQALSKRKAVAHGTHGIASLAVQKTLSLLAQVMRQSTKMANDEVQLLWQEERMLHFPASWTQ